MCTFRKVIHFWATFGAIGPKKVVQSKSERGEIMVFFRSLGLAPDRTDVAWGVIYTVTVPAKLLFIFVIFSKSFNIFSVYGRVAVQRIRFESGGPLSDLLALLR